MSTKYYKTILLSTKLWTWLYENPDKDKMESPYWERISNMLGNCPLCECHEGQCDSCVLYHHDACHDYYVKPLGLGKLKHVAYYYAVDHLFITHKDLYKKKCARAFIAAKLRRELRRLKRKGVKGE